MLDTHENNLAYECIPDGYKLLILDDDPVYSSIIEETAEEQGILATSILNSNDISFIAQYEFDVIFLDYQLGENNGLEIAPILNSFFPKTPVVMISSNTKIRDMQHCAPEISEFIPKTVPPADIIRMGIEIVNKMKIKH